MDTDTVKKQTRMVEHDRQKYQAAVKQQLTKQADTISALRKENEKLKSEVASKTGDSYKFADEEASSQLQHDIEALERKVNFERMRQRDLEKEVTVARMDLTRARRKMGGVNVTQDNIQLIDKQVRVLENRLDQALVQFNEALAYNRELRQQIDNLRGERKVFTEIYRKLEADLHEKKKKMAQIIEESNKDYEECDGINEALKKLQESAKKDSETSDEHFRQLDEMMQRYKQYKEQQHQQQLAQQQQQQAQKSPAKPKHDESRVKEQDREAARSKTTSQPDPQVNLGDAQDTDEEDGDLQLVIDKLKEGTGIQELDLLHQKFVKSEEQSFSLYNYVNELKTEEEKLQSEIDLLQQQHDRQRGDTQRSAALKALENELADAETKHEKLTSQTAKARETLEQVRKDTQSLFDKISCSKKMAEELAGTHDVNELNILTFLGIIEHRANELLFASNLAAAQEMKKRAAGKQEARRNRDEARENGDAVDEDDFDDERDDVSVAEARAKFVGVGPKDARGKTSAKDMAISALASVPAADPNADDDNTNETPDVLNHADLRAHAEERLKKREAARKSKAPRSKAK